MLDDDLARDFAGPFFAWRSEMSLFKLQTLTLKTGEHLRRFPQWAPAYHGDECRWSCTVLVRPAVGDDGVLKVESE